MTLPLPLHRSGLQEAFRSLRQDLLDEDGPQISTMRNYRFAILHYAPAQEFEVRAEVQRLSTDMIAGGWMVLTIDLQTLLFERIRSQPEEGWAERVIERERRLASKDRGRALVDLKELLQDLVDGPNGLAAACSRIIRQHLQQHPEKADRTLALIGGAGGLYPFFRSSGLLRHLDGNTDNVPVVLLYPGTRQGKTGLSFMGVLDADNDYRPRIYP